MDFGSINTVYSIASTVGFQCSRLNLRSVGVVHCLHNWFLTQKLLAVGQKHGRWASGIGKHCAPYAFDFPGVMISVILVNAFKIRSLLRNLYLSSHTSDFVLICYVVSRCMDLLFQEQVCDLQHNESRGPRTSTLCFILMPLNREVCLIGITRVAAPCSSCVRFLSYRPVFKCYHFEKLLCKLPFCTLK